MELEVNVALVNRKIMQGKLINSGNWLEFGKWIIPLIVSIVGVGVSFIPQSNVYQKSLSYEVLSASEIRPPSSPALTDIKVSLGDQVLENIGITLVKLTNNGKLPINRGDFDSPIIIEVQADTQLLRSTVQSQSPENLNIEISQEKNTIFVKPMLLNPNDTFIVQLITTGSMLKPLVSSRISGVSDVKQVVSSSQKPISISRTVIGFSLLLVYGIIGGCFAGLLGYIKFSKIWVVLLINTPIALGSASFLNPIITVILNKGILYIIAYNILFLILLFLTYIYARRKVKQFCWKLESDI